MCATQSPDVRCCSNCKTIFVKCYSIELCPTCKSGAFSHGIAEAPYKYAEVKNGIWVLKEKYKNE
jgi:hypothetical protein